MQVSNHVGPLKRIKAKKAVALALQGVPYAQIAKEIGSDAKPEYQRQITYSVLQSPAGRAELAKMEAKIAAKYTAEDAIRELDEALEMSRTKNQPLPLIQAVLGKAKIAGLLIDQVKDVTELAQKEALDAKAAKSLSELKVSAEGIETEQEVANTK